MFLEAHNRWPYLLSLGGQFNSWGSVGGRLYTVPFVPCLSLELWECYLLKVSLKYRINYMCWSQETSTMECDFQSQKGRVPQPPRWLGTRCAPVMQKSPRCSWWIERGLVVSIRLSQDTSCAFQLVGPIGFSRGQHKSPGSDSALKEPASKGEPQGLGPWE